MRGFTELVDTIWLLILLSPLIGAWYLILPEFIANYDPLTKLFLTLLGPSLFFGIIFLKKNENEILRFGGQK